MNLCNKLLRLTWIWVSVSLAPQQSEICVKCPFFTPILGKFSLAHSNPGKRSTDNFTKISRQISRHLWQRKTEKIFTSALLQGSCSERLSTGKRVYIHAESTRKATYAIPDMAIHMARSKRRASVLRSLCQFWQYISQGQISAQRDFAPPEPESRAEFWETIFGRPNFGPEFLGRIF